MCLHLTPLFIYNEFNNKLPDLEQHLTPYHHCIYLIHCASEKLDYIDCTGVASFRMINSILIPIPVISTNVYIIDALIMSI